MRLISVGLAVGGLVSALVAAAFWYASARGRVPIFYITPAGEYESAVESFLRRGARFNKWAAIWTGLASLLSAASAVIGSLTS